jgi:hypothetical protein
MASLVDDEALATADSRREVVAMHDQAADLRDTLRLNGALWYRARTAAELERRLRMDGHLISALSQGLALASVPSSTFEHDREADIYAPGAGDRHGLLPARTSCATRDCAVAPATSMH